MSKLLESVVTAERFHEGALRAFEKGQFARAESLYRAAVATLTTVIDPLHGKYVAFLKGLLVCLETQQKTSEALQVALILKQLTNPD